MQEYRVSVNDLRVGVFIRLGVPWFNHPFLFGSFKIKDRQQIETLKELGFSTVLCVPEKSDQLPLPTSASCLSVSTSGTEADESLPSGTQALWKIKKERIERLRAQKKKYHQCEKQFERTLERVKSIMNNLGTASQEVVKEASTLVGDMVSSLLSDTNVIVHLMNTKPGNENIFYHSLNTAVLGLLLGREYGLEADALQKLGMGLIFHDIGKQRITKKVLNKQKPLTPPELKLYQLHPIYGAEMISTRVPGFPPEALEIVTKHHEAIDGKGYPAGLSGDQIPCLVRLASVVNAYDGHCNKQDPKDSFTPYQALSFMFRKQTGQLDTQIIAHFVHCLGVYPPGTLVKLSNGSIGMVVAVNTRESLRPSVLLYDPDIPKNEALVFDLTDDPDLTIVENIHPSKLTPQVYEYLSPRTRITYFTETPGKAGP